MSAAEPLTGVGTRELWSVTTLLDKAFGIGPGLATWITRTVATAALEERAAWQAIEQTAGSDEAIRYLMGTRYRKSDRAKIRGTAVHKAAEKIALGQDPGEIEPDYLPYVEQLVAWMEAFSPRFLMAEAPVYNVENGYAGTLDGIMDLEGRRVLFDYKTTDTPPDVDKARPPWPEVALQLVAYRRATEVGLLVERVETQKGRYYIYDPTQHHEPMPDVDSAVCIVISPYDCRAVPVVTNEDIWQAFLVAYDAARWHEDTSKRVFGAPLRTPRREE